MIIGLVGKPSSGKSTFFNAATLANVPVSPVPFTTIKPNTGTAYVRVEDAGPELGVVSNPRTGFVIGKIRYTPFTLMDVAGLVPGAHEGKGLGNQFLNDLNQAHALIHIVDFSGSMDENGNFIGYGKHDPEKDILFLEEELNLWYFDVIKRNFEKMQRMRRAGKKSIEIIMEILSSFRVFEHMAESVVREYGEIENWDEERIKKIAKSLREQTKPTVIAANKIDVPSAKENYNRLKDKYKNIVPCSAEAELALRRASKAGMIEYAPGESDFRIVGNVSEEQKNALESIRNNVLKVFGSTGVQQVLDYAVFGLLEYKAVFPVGEKLMDKEGRVLPDCFLLEKNATVYDLAMRIHSDIAKGLLYGFDMKTKRKLAKDAILKHRDVVELVSAAK
ncbi:MAG: redox-regulated ATPase YchF [Candidatus Anstonellales archaeon]